MEYKKNANEIQSTSEYKNTPKEYHSSAKEYFSATEEIHSPASEFLMDSNLEEETQSTSSPKKKRNLRKKIRQMGYAVAASVAVVTVSQTLTPETSVDNTPPEAYEKEDGYQFEWPKVPGLDGYLTENENQTAQGNAENSEPPEESEAPKVPAAESYLIMDSWNAMSLADSGLFLYEENGVYGLMNRSGEIIVEPQYEHGYWYAPNDMGYSVVSYPGIAFVLDKTGNEIFSHDTLDDWDASYSELQITDKNIIYQVYTYETDEGVFITAKYFHTDGTLIFETAELIGDIFVSTPFNDGAAVLTGTIQGIWDTYLIYPNGTVVPASVGDYWADGPYCDGYYLAYNVEGGARALVNPSLRTIEGGFFLEFVLSSYAPAFEYEDIYFQGYFENGLYLPNFNTYACIEAINGDETLCILFDFKDGNSNTRNLDRIIAMYDKIYMDDFKYLCVRQDEQYFYIDLNGNIVSDTYSDATSFNEEGYALILDENNTAYLINEHFEKLISFKNITALGSSGEAFELAQIEGPNILYFPEITAK